MSEVRSRRPLPDRLLGPADPGPRSWPFAVPRGHPARRLWWSAIAVYAVVLVLVLLDRNGSAVWVLALGLVLWTTGSVWAFRENRRLRREPAAGA